MDVVPQFRPGSRRVPFPLSIVVPASVPFASAAGATAGAGSTMEPSPGPLPRRGVRRAAVLPLAAAGLLAAAGCQDPSAPLVGTPRGAPRVFRAVVGEVSAGFDPSDTYASAEMQVQRTYDVPLAGPMIDPLTGEATSRVVLAPKPDRLRIELGYDAAGNPRYVLTAVGAPGDPTTTLVDFARVTVIDAGGVTSYRADGTPLQSSFPGGGALGAQGVTHLGAPASLAPVPAVAGAVGRSADVLAGITVPGARIGLAVGAFGGRGPSATAGEPRAAAPLPANVRLESRLLGGGALVRQFAPDADGVGRLAIVETTARTSAGGKAGQTTTRVSFGAWTIHEAGDRDAVRAAMRAGAAVAPTAVAPMNCETAAPVPVSGGGISLTGAGLGAARPTVNGCEGPDDPPPPEPDPGPAPSPNPNYFGGRACALFWCLPPTPGGECVGTVGLTPSGGFCYPPFTPDTPNTIPAAPNTGIWFQHGILSDAQTWGWMKFWTTRDYPGTPWRSNSLSHQRRLSAQADELMAITRNTNTGLVGNYVFVGHSQGGLISRYLYQSYMQSSLAQQMSVPVQGVITIGSPHLGAPIAPNGLTLAATALHHLTNAETKACSFPVVMPSACEAIVAAGAFVERPLRDLAMSEAMIDLRPGSSFLTSLNMQPEPFQRVAIASHAEKRWVLARLYGDMTSTCASDDQTCNGQHWVDRAEQGYAAARACEAIFLYITTEPIGWACAEVADGMDQMDQAWDRFTAPGEATDGIVPGASQSGWALSADRRFVLPSGNSHVGETKDPRIYQAVQTALARYFGMAPR